MTEKVDDGSAITVFGPPTDDEIKGVLLRMPSLNREDAAEQVLADKMEAHVQSLTTEEIIERYSHEPSFNWEYLPKHLGNSYGGHDVDSRDYSWFGAVTGGAIRSYGPGSGPFEPRGIPEDVSPLIARACNAWSGDGHTHSWLSVDEILASETLKGYRHYQWIKRNIPDPSRTRMVFFFDN